MFRKKKEKVQGVPQISLSGLENVLIQGDLTSLTSEQRVSYYTKVCNSLGLNPLTKPFEYLALKGRLVLYAKKDATDQLRKKHHISIIDIQHHITEASATVVVKGQDTEGKIDVATGVVSLRGLSGDAYANALMKAETKAKRRLTLSICGLGMLDETEIETIPSASLAAHKPKTKKIAQPPETTEDTEDHETTGKEGQTGGAFLLAVLERAVQENMITKEHKERVLGKHEELAPSHREQYARDVIARIEALRTPNEG